MNEKLNDMEEYRIAGAVTVEHPEAAIPEMVTVERLEVPVQKAAIAEAVTAERPEAAILEITTVKVQHQVVTAEIVETVMLQVEQRVEIVAVRMILVR